MTKNIVVPDLGEGIEKVEIAAWQKKVGDVVHIDEDVVEVVTDKASFFVPSTVEGTITKICVEEGSEVVIGGVLAEVR